MDMNDIMNANNDAGYHFFEPSSKRFFHSRIGRTVYGGQYFVTSEQRETDYHTIGPCSQLYPPTQRRYTVRRANSNGTITMIGDFMEHETRSDAIRAIKSIPIKGL